LNAGVVLVRDITYPSHFPASHWRYHDKQKHALTKWIIMHFKRVLWRLWICPFDAHIG